MPTDMHQLPREEFIEKNLGLVHACAGRFKGRGIEYEELYAAGCLGLVKACDGFDTGRGVCFSTYAVPVILGEIKKLFRDGGTVKVSRSLKELSLKINAERERCLKRTGQEPGVTELAETLGTTPEQIALAIRAALPTLSLTPVDDEDGLREFDVPVESPEEALSDRIGLAEVMDRLDSGDRQLIRLRFFAGRTQSETARVHPVGAGHARPATSPPPAVNLPPPTHSPKTPNPATLLPPTTSIICARQPPSPQYTPCPNFTLKLCRKNQKNLQKPVDKGHTTCYNNQAVSRAQPAAAAAGAFTYSLYAVF